MSAPRTPVVGWDMLRGKAACGLPCVDELPHGRITTSGRAALYLALRELALPKGARVLVPTYHCPTMIAPAVKLGLTLVFYPIGPNGLPCLDRIDLHGPHKPRAMIVAHYFGFGQSLAGIRDWCDQHKISLIEDCAHTFIGWAGERPVGHWGDFATASLTKFLPVSEAGWVGSASHALTSPPLAEPGISRELRGVNSVLERAVAAGNLTGLGWILRLLATVRQRAGAQLPADEPGIKAPSPLQAPIVDLSRVNESATWLSRWMRRTVPRHPLLSRRQANFDLFALRTRELLGVKALHPIRGNDTVPYVFPLLVDEPERVYQFLRRRGIAVLRWDQRWPGTPSIPGDTGNSWSMHLLQFLCHQDLRAADVERACAALQEALGGCS